MGNSSNHVLILGCMVSKDMGYIFIFFFISTICFANVSPLYGVQILSPWITEMMKQRYEDIGPEGFKQEMQNLHEKKKEVTTTQPPPIVLNDREKFLQDLLLSLENQQVG